MIRPTASLRAFLLLLLLAQPSSGRPEQRERRTQSTSLLDTVFQWYSDAQRCWRQTVCDISYSDRNCCGVDQTTKTIFVTSTEYSADIQSSGFEPGQVGADSICTRAASEAKLEGIYYAWFATSNADAPNVRFNQHLGSYVRPDGQELFKCYHELSSGLIPPVSLWMDEKGRLVKSSQGAPTNLNEFGWYFNSGRDEHYELEEGDGSEAPHGGDGDDGDDVEFGNCASFTYDDSRGDQYDPIRTPVGITESAFGFRPNAYLACDEPIRFICVQQ